MVLLDFQARKVILVTLEALGLVEYKDNQVQVGRKVLKVLLDFQDHQEVQDLLDL